MIIKVKYAEDKEAILNPDCPVRVLQDYIQNLMIQSGSTTSGATNFEIDLCDESGQLKNLNALEPWSNGLETGIFTARATYIVLLVERDETGAISRYQLMLNKTSRQYSELIQKLRRQTPSLSKQLKSRERLQGRSEKLKRGSADKSTTGSGHSSSWNLKTKSTTQ